MGQRTFLPANARHAACYLEINRGASRGTPRAGSDRYVSQDTRPLAHPSGNLNVARSCGPTFAEERKFVVDSIARSNGLQLVVTNDAFRGLILDVKQRKLCATGVLVPVGGQRPTPGRY